MIVATVAAFSNVESRVEDLISEEELLNIKTPEDVHNKIVEMMQNDNENSDFLTSRRDALIQELNEIDDALNLADAKTPAKDAKAAATKTVANIAAVVKAGLYTNVTAAASVKGCDALNVTDAKKKCYDGLKTAAEAQLKAHPKDTNVKAYYDVVEAAYSKTYGGSSLWIWIVVAILVVAAGVGVFFFLKKKGDGSEGGECDGYTKFIDQELS